MREPNCVGAFVRDARQQVYVQRRTPNRSLLPGTWDIVGGHVEAGESPEEALAREIEEETGWSLRRVEAVIADWEWLYAGVVRRELDYLVEVDGDLSAPRLEEDKHDAYTWIGPDNLEQMMEGRADGDRRLRDLVAKALRTRLTERLRLEPVGHEHATELWELHQPDAVSQWHDGAWSTDDARRTCAAMATGWERDGVHQWLAYDRTSGDLIGHGGLSRLATDLEATHAIRSALGSGPWARDRLEVGWTVHPDHWGQGYATEIGQAGLDFGFGELGAAQIVAFTESPDARSRGVMERLGMRFRQDISLTGERFALYSLERPRAGAAVASGAFRRESRGSSAATPGDT